jgi:hypothetical protein
VQKKRAASNTTEICVLYYEVKGDTKLLVDSKIRTDEDFLPETRKVRTELIPYLREAKK